MTRKFDDRRAESTAVRRALKDAGINSKVSQGRGTAWGWITINIGDLREQFGEHLNNDQMRHCPSNCKACRAADALRKETMRIAWDVTGRTGEYSGRISLNTQDHWHRTKGSIPILQTEWAAKIDQMLAETDARENAERCERIADDIKGAIETDDAGETQIFTGNTAATQADHNAKWALREAGVAREYANDAETSAPDSEHVKIANDHAIRADKLAAAEQDTETGATDAEQSATVLPFEQPETETETKPAPLLTLNGSSLADLAAVTAAERSCEMVNWEIALSTDCAELRITVRPTETTTLKDWRKIAGDASAETAVLTERIGRDNAAILG